MDEEPSNFKMMASNVKAAVTMSAVKALVESSVAELACVIISFIPGLVNNIIAFLAVNYMMGFIFYFFAEMIAQIASYNRAVKEMEEMMKKRIESE